MAQGAKRKKAQVASREGAREKDKYSNGKIKPRTENRFKNSPPGVFQFTFNDWLFDFV
jgi:hypothetical protein